MCSSPPHGSHFVLEPWITYTVLCVDYNSVKLGRGGGDIINPHAKILQDAFLAFSAWNLCNIRSPGSSLCLVISFCLYKSEIKKLKKKGKIHNNVHFLYKVVTNPGHSGSLLYSGWEGHNR